MKDTISPCTGCQERSAECHGVCEKYAKWLEEHREYKRENYRRKYPEIYEYIVGRVYRGGKR